MAMMKGFADRPVSKSLSMSTSLRGQSKRPSPSKDPEYIHACHVRDHALSTVQTLMKSRGNSLQTWLRNFDENHDNHICLAEFCEGMLKLGYDGDPSVLFHRIDIDRSGDINLEEVDIEGAKMWMRFRLWCVGTFADQQDMVMKLSGGTGIVTREDFVYGLRRFGWTGEDEVLFFECLVNGNEEEDEAISAEDCKWFAKDKKKQQRKEHSRRRALVEQAHHLNERAQIASSLLSFKKFLQRKYSNVLRAWRCALDLDGSMSIQKHELFKAVREVGWTGDVRLLWKGLDSDNSGVTSLQEVDMKTAERLAKFKQFTAEKFGSAIETFRAFDTLKKGKLREAEFIEACRKHGFGRVTKSLFRGLDWQRNKYIMEEDLAFVDSWRCPLYLICGPNEHAARDFKATLLRLYSNYPRAWRVLLDRDNSNCVSWDEFQAAAKKINFTGDLAGAWRFLDDDASGFITLHEIDPVSSELMQDFKMWVDEEFGGVRSAFMVWDIDKSKSVSMREFRNACSRYGYEGDVNMLFNVLDIDSAGQLSLQELNFLDEWETPGEVEELLLQQAQIHGEGESSRKPIKTEFIASPRLQELARPKPKDALGMSPCPSKSSFADSISKFVRPTTSQSPYFPKVPKALGGANKQSRKFLMSTDPGTDWPTSETSAQRIEAIKNMILQKPVEEIMPRWPHCGKLGWLEEEDLIGLRNNTKSLRNHTIELLSKVEKYSLPSLGQQEPRLNSIVPVSLPHMMTTR